MKRLIIYTILALALAACSNDTPELLQTGKTERHEMRFRALTQSLSRASGPTGIYKDSIYPVNRLYLTAFHRDSTNLRQYYFRDRLLSFDDATGDWRAPDWYWPIQGEMSFLSYWCPGFSRAPVFDEIYDIDGNYLPRMIVDATDLDSRTDFLYLSQTGVRCPQVETTKLVFTHGLTWITITLSAQVLNAAGTDTDQTKTTELINALKVNKVVLEDCARKGFATIIPGAGINWKTYNDTVSPIVSYVRDQVYYRPSDVSSNYISPYIWAEMEDGSTFTAPYSLPALTKSPQQLGMYSPETDSYIYTGLLIIPQNKTAITVDYTITDKNDKEINKIERYELRDNSEAWLPGYHYNYDIVFRNYNDYNSNFEVITTWSGMNNTANNQCYDDYRSIVLISKANSINGNGKLVIDPLHDAGSALGDDMDYPEGPRVF